MKFIVLIVLFVTIILLQFFQPEKNRSGIDSNHIFMSGDIPSDIELILAKSCLDCHSNQTNYKWYDHIAPASWIVRKHIDEGREELNFSDWAIIDDYEKISLLGDIADEVVKKRMPLKSYTMIHMDAKVNDEEIERITAWAEQYSNEIFQEIRK